MIRDFHWGGELASDEGGGRFAFGDLPCHLDILAESGREVLVLGDVQRGKEFNHARGDNAYGFRETSGLVCCEDVLRQFDIQVSEDEVVRHALIEGLCTVTDSAESSGGSSLEAQARILADGGVPAYAVSGADLGDLSGWVRQGRGIILGVNAGELWDDAQAFGSGDANHAVVVTGSAVDPATGELLGFYINDSGRGFPGDSGRFVELDRLQYAWVDAGGAAVLSVVARAR